MKGNCATCKHFDFDPKNNWHYYMSEDEAVGDCKANKTGANSYSSCEKWEEWTK